MNNKQTSNNCYVFSQNTLDSALKEWLEIEKIKDPTEEESLQIALAALPWFLEHLQQNGSTYMFTYDGLVTEMKLWESLQISDYPHQIQRIKDTCEKLLRFFQSESIRKYKMMIQV